MLKLKGFWPYVVCFSAALFFAYELMQFHMMNAIAPMLMRDLQMNATKFAGLCSTYLLADVIFLLPAGIILDYFSPRRIILSALSLCITGTVLFALSTDLYTASIAHFLSGIGNAFSLLSCIVLVSRWFPVNKQAFVIGVIVTIGMLGGVIAQTPFSLLAESLTWRTALLIDAGFGLFILAIIYKFVHDGKVLKDTKTKMPFWAGVFRCISNKQNILCGLYTSCMNMPLMVLSAVWGSLYLTQIYKLSLSQASFIVSMICFGTIIGSPLYGYISDKSGVKKRWMYMGAIFSLIIISTIMSFTEFSQQTLLILFLLLGVFSSSQVLGYPIITENNPQSLTGTAMGVAAVIIMGLPMIFQSLSGYLLDLHWDGKMFEGAPLYSYENYVLSFSIFPILFLVSIIVTGFCGRRIN